MFIGRFALRCSGTARPLYRKFASSKPLARIRKRRRKNFFWILAYHANTAFARDHGFDHPHCCRLPSRVNVAAYERSEPYIRRVMQGETNALLADPHVLMFALTSGTTAARKHIPITQQYVDDYKRSWNLWGLRAIKQHKHIFLKPIMQLAGDADEYRTEAAFRTAISRASPLKCKSIMRWMYVVPPATEAERRTTAPTSPCEWACESRSAC
jgi:hypothetical protein